MYMNKTKRNLILAAAIINLIGITANLILSIILILNAELLQDYLTYFYFISYSTNIVYVVISFAAGLAGSILLLYAVRAKGKYFRLCHTIYIVGFVIVVVCGGYVPWILLLISMFIPDVIVMNTKSEVRAEEKAENKAMEDKKNKIEELKRLRDEGVITEEEYKQKLFEIL